MDQLKKAKELADKYNGIHYDNYDEFNRQIDELHEEAACNDLVVLCACSDDLLEIYGAIRAEIYVQPTTDIPFTYEGPIVQDEDKKGCNNCSYFKKEIENKQIITVTSNKDIEWLYKTDIPHVTFDILDYTDIYCRAIIFRRDSLNKPGND